MATQRIEFTELEPGVVDVVEPILFGARVEISDDLEVVSAIPETVEIGSLFDDRLRMNGPLTVEIEQEVGFFLAKLQGFDEFGYSDNPMGAVDDLRLTLAELYWSLKEDQDNLGVHLSELWQRILGIIREA